MGESGFAVGGKLSLADVLIHNALAETLSKEQAGQNQRKASCSFSATTRL